MSSAASASRPLRSQSPGWFEAVLPPGSFSLLVLLILLLPLVLLTAESLFLPVLEYFKSLLIPVNAGMTYAKLPLILIIKLVAFAGFTFTAVTLLTLKLVCLYMTTWSRFLPPPHPEHPAYHPHPGASMVALFNWTFYRAYQVLGPAASWTGVTLAAGCIFFWVFNSFTGFDFFAFQLQITLGFFALSTLSFFTGLAYLKVLRKAVKSALGSTAAILEPEQPAEVIYDRVERLSSYSPWGWLLYPLNLFFYLVVICEIAMLLTLYDIERLPLWSNEMLIILSVEVITLAIFLALNSLKLTTYHHALSRFYRIHRAQPARRASRFPS